MACEAIVTFIEVDLTVGFASWNINGEVALVGRLLLVVDDSICRGSLMHLAMIDLFHW